MITSHKGKGGSGRRRGCRKCCRRHRRQTLCTRKVGATGSKNPKPCGKEKIKPPSHKTRPRERRSSDAIRHRGHDFAWHKFTVLYSRVSRSVRIPPAARCEYYPTPLLVTDMRVCMHSQFHPDSGRDLRHHIWGLPAPEPIKQRIGPMLSHMRKSDIMKILSLRNI